MKRSPLPTWFKSLLLALVVSIAGCTTTIKPGARSINYAAREKIPLNVALNLTDELRNAKWEQKALTGGATVMAVGPALTEDAPQCARNTFREVVEISNGGTPPKPIDATLTPKMAFIGIKYGQTMFSKDTITLKLEWTFTDPAGNLIWADTVTGQGESKGGFAKDLKLAIEDAFKKSQDAMLTSQAIQQFAAKKQAALRQ
jgi:hypothetical protein